MRHLPDTRGQSRSLPAKAGTHSANLRKCAVYGLDSCLRGNDRRFVWADIPNDTTTCGRHGLEPGARNLSTHGETWSYAWKCSVPGLRPSFSSAGRARLERVPRQALGARVRGQMPSSPKPAQIARHGGSVSSSEVIPRYGTGARCGKSGKRLLPPCCSPSLPQHGSEAGGSEGNNRQ